ncbi:MAG TPA: preprotein translocase subunit SecE [Gaiellaceae bacterium]|nr:preprotein translocase subunit SecE [Gaiellaceae bacterium]
MAKQTRSERRARRAAQAESRAAAVERVPQPQRQPQPAARPPAEAAAKPSSDGHRAPGGGVRRFVTESWGELQKVDWPGQQQLIQGTAVVLIACFITGLYLFICDEAFKRLVQHVLLR